MSTITKKTSCSLVALLLLNVLVFAKSAALLDEIKALSREMDHSSPHSNFIGHEMKIEEPKKKFEPETTTEIQLTDTKSNTFAVGSIFTAFLALLIPFKACYSSENCKNYFMDVFRLTDRRKRDLEYLETVLVALLDNFVENEAKDDRTHVQEIGRPILSEPLLVTLAKYFDKYADKAVKNHIKVLVFFLVHILGNIFGVVQQVIGFLSSYHIL